LAINFVRKGGSFFRAKLIKFEFDEAYYWRGQLWIAGFLRKVFIYILVGYGLPENRQISQDTYRLEPKGYKLRVTN